MNARRARALLNLGHTFGRDRGRATGIWLHGEAVAAGLFCCAPVPSHGMLGDAELQRVIESRASGTASTGATGVARYQNSWDSIRRWRAASCAWFSTAHRPAYLAADFDHDPSRSVETL